MKTKIKYNGVTKRYIITFYEGFSESGATKDVGAIKIKRDEVVDMVEAIRSREDLKYVGCYNCNFKKQLFRLKKNKKQKTKQSSIVLKIVKKIINKINERR